MRALIVACVVAGTAAVAGAAEPGAGVDARAAFERLKGLAGEWEGVPEKAGAPAPSANYRVASGGSVVMETLFPGSEHEMITMYHLDGDALVLTHYCGAGNQPHMRLSRQSTASELRFDFDGGTNLDPGKDMHMHGVTITFPSEGRLEADWSLNVDGKPAGGHHLSFKRKTP